MIYSEIFGLIGPSGCGKTTIAWTVIGMINEMNGFAKGKIFYKGQQIFNDKYLDIKKLWWKEIAIVPQVSMSSFNPSLTIKETLIETMDACNYENDKNERCFEIMDMVQLDKKVLNYYPHEMSGGMKQRAAIATAMLLNPSLLILDESTTRLVCPDEGADQQEEDDQAAHGLAGHVRGPGRADGRGGHVGGVHPVGPGQGGAQGVGGGLAQLIGLHAHRGRACPTAFLKLIVPKGFFDRLDNF